MYETVSIWLWETPERSDYTQGLAIDEVVREQTSTSPVLLEWHVWHSMTLPYRGTCLTLHCARLDTNNATQCHSFASWPRSKTTTLENFDSDKANLPSSSPFHSKPQNLNESQLCTHPLLFLFFLTPTQTIQPQKVSQNPFNIPPLPHSSKEASQDILHTLPLHDVPLPQRRHPRQASTSQVR